MFAPPVTGLEPRRRPALRVALRVGGVQVQPRRLAAGAGFIFTPPCLLGMENHY